MQLEFDEASLEAEVARTRPLHAELSQDEKLRLSTGWAAHWGGAVPVASVVQSERGVEATWSRVSHRSTASFYITDPEELRRAAAKTARCLIDFTEAHPDSFVVAAVWPSDPWRNAVAVALPDARRWFDAPLDGETITFWVARPRTGAPLDRLINVVLLDAVVVTFVAGDFSALAEPDTEFVRFGALVPRAEG